MAGNPGHIGRGVDFCSRVPEEFIGRECAWMTSNCRGLSPGD